MTAGTDRPVPPFDTAGFKDAMGMFTTGVTIVAGIDDGQPVGFTCQSFLSLSIDPPYVAVAPARTSTSWPRIARSGSFCVNVLTEVQEGLGRSFAVSGGSKFDSVDWYPAPGTGSPVIAGTLAWVDCQLRQELDCGGHTLFVGEVLDAGFSGTEDGAVLRMEDTRMNYGG